MRQLLRRLAVTAILTPVAAGGVTTMIATPAEAALAKHGPSQSGSWMIDRSQPDSWETERPQRRAWDADRSRRRTWETDRPQRRTWETAPDRPTTPAPAKPTPATPAPAKPTPSGSTPASSTDQALQSEINRLINVQRESNGCAALTVNDQLTTAARDHSAWMARTGTFSHTGEGGSTFVARARAAGYAQPSAENIAMGYRSAAQVVDGWMNSSGHRANILNCRSTTVGVGVVRTSDGTPYYTQDFGY
ncbi:MAG: CAP domain-containing protein [Actinomycetota bacterium]|nr:CAP domain-containing protein [Actinomycetota bacterium]